MHPSVLGSAWEATVKEDMLEMVASNGRSKACRVVDTCGDPDRSKTISSQLIWGLEGGVATSPSSPQRVWETGLAVFRSPWVALEWRDSRR